MLKLGIGVITCKRFNYLKKTLDSLYSYNPSLVELPLVIADDNSHDETIDKMNHFWPNANIVHSKKRVGYPTNVANLILTAQRIGIDVLYWSTNDIECIRLVDFESLVKFFDNPNVGQIQFIHWKGKLGDKKRERANYNWTTKNPIERETPVKVGSELLIPANWSWTAYSQMQRLNVGDFIGTAINKNPKKEKRMVEAEIIMMNNWYNTGLKNYECQNQPFMNQDWKGDNNTGYEDV